MKTEVITNTIRDIAEHGTTKISRKVWDYYDVQCDDGVIRSGGDDDIEFAEAGLLAWDEQTNDWISNEESREIYEATL